MFWWTFPFVSPHTLGNDYGMFVPAMQMELQFALRTGTAPLFVPGFTGGQPAGALTVGQLLHPITHLAARMPGYWSGHVLDVLTLLKLISLGLTHWVVFRFLRRLWLEPMLAWLVAFAAVYNLRMLDSFRYNIALESYTALMLLCASLGYLFLQPESRWPRLAVVLCAFLLVASGHPQWAYFGLLGASVFCIALPWALPAIVPGWRVSPPARAMVTALLAMAVGILLASASAVPFYFEFVRNNTSRVGRDFGWAVEVRQSVGNLLASLYDPLHSDVHGSFAGNALIVLVAGVPALLLFRLRVPPVVLALWGFCVVVVLAGGTMPLYRFLYDHAPLWSSFRVPGRVTLMMMPALLLLMAWAAAPHEGEGAPRRLAALAAVGAVALGAWQVVGHILPRHEPPYSPYRINRLGAWVDAIPLALLLASLLVLMAVWKEAQRRPWLEAVFALIVVSHTAVLMFWGTWRWPKPPTPTLASLLEGRRAAAWLTGWRYEPTLASAPMERYVGRADPDPRVAWISHRCLSVGSLDEAYGFVRDRHWPDELIVEATAGACVSGAEKELASIDSVNLDYVSFNRVAFDVQSTEAGLLAVNLPYTEWKRTSWGAEVNGRRTPILRANGILQAIAIPAGRSRVEWRFWSWPSFVGVLISTTMAAALLAYAAGALPRRVWRIAARVGAVVVMAACVVLWRTHLYTGDGWGTAYSWTSDRTTLK